MDPSPWSMNLTSGKLQLSNLLCLGVFWVFFFFFYFFVFCFLYFVLFCFSEVFVLETESLVKAMQLKANLDF